MIHPSLRCKNIFSITVLFASITAVLLIQSCRDKSTPEIVASDFIQRVESTIEKQSLVGLRNLVSKNYHDEYSREQRDLLALASSYLIRTKSIHLFIDLQSAQSISESMVRCRLLVAFTATPIDNRNLLLDLNADVYWFDIDLIEESEDWRVVKANWQQAMIQDLFSEEYETQS